VSAGETAWNRTTTSTVETVVLTTDTSATVIIAPTSNRRPMGTLDESPAVFECVVCGNVAVGDGGIRCFCRLMQRVDADVDDSSSAPGKCTSTSRSRPPDD